MIQEATCPIGTLLKTSGNHGEIILQLTQIESENIRNWESIFLYIEGGLVPFFFSSIKPKARYSALVCFEDVESVEAAELLIGTDCYAPCNRIDDVQVKSQSFIGYDVFNGKELVGIVTGIEPLPNNPLLLVTDDAGKTYSLPLHEDFIVKVSERRKKIVLKLPEGLLDI